MIKNLLKTAYRSLLKNKGFTSINIGGLALGLATCLLIVFYVADELSYDRFNTNANRIFRVNTDLKYGENETAFAITAAPVADAMLKEFPEVENTMRMGQAVNIRFKKGDEVIEEKNAFYCENSIFGIFTLPLLHGDARTALKEPNAVVINKSLALKYFNTADAVGKTLFMASDSSLHKVTGVMEDMPGQSHFKADVLLAVGPNQNNNWSSFNTSTYILLKNEAGRKTLETKLAPFVRSHLNSASFDYDKFAAGGNYIKLSLTPLTDIHLHSNRQREIAPNGNVQYIYIFSAIALFILLLACINFMNLSTARSASRAREVGVRKVLGSAKRHLVLQFLAESLMVTFGATLLAILLAWALLPLFNEVSGKSLVVTGQVAVWAMPSLLAIVVAVGVLAGSYPAFFLSAFQPVDVLKGKLATGFKGGRLRSVLVVAQFAISVFLIIGTLVIYNQLNFIQNKNLGFNRSQVLIVKSLNSVSDPLVLQHEVKQLPGVLNATLSNYIPTSGISYTNYVTAGEGKQLETQFWTVDDSYISTMGMQLVQGRNFNKKFATDSSAVIINQTMANAIGYKGGADDKIKDGKDYRIIGVVKDFNFASLRDNVTPLMLVMQPDWIKSMAVRLNTSNLKTSLQQIENKWKALASNQRFEYSFMDEDFDALYRTEQRMGTLFVIFTSLAIVIACLGLFGLAAYAAEQRSREISVRKILGADVATLTAMLTKDFIKLVLVAIFIAMPIAWLVMQKWLQGFAYRESIHWWIFAVTGIGAIAIAFATVSYQSVKASLVNPVESLRGE